jgi:hypothetical protein
MINKLTFSCRATNYKGYPTIKLFLNDKEMAPCVIDQDLFTIAVDLDYGANDTVLIIERYGKTDQNVSVDAQGNIVNDQYLEILDAKIDNMPVPDFILNSNTRFEFNDQCHVGSRFFGPNGTWTFEFKTPFIQYVLDQKILHEAKFSNDYAYAWSYKLGPDSVVKLTNEIDTVITKVKNIL